LIYLDNNATTQLDPLVIDAMLAELRLAPSNPSSQHTVGQQTRRRMDEMLEQIGRVLGTRLNEPGSARVILTSGGTEANNLALRGLRGGQGPLIVSQIEHSSVLAVAQHEERRGRPVRYLRVNQHGVVDIPMLQEWLQQSFDPSTVVSIMSANNETGVIQPLRQISELCQRSRVALHIDATQSVTKQEFLLDQLGAAAVTFTPHKFHGPVGIGALWLAANEKIDPLLFGGQQQLGSRPGTEPVALLAGMCAALTIGSEQITENSVQIRFLRDHLENSLLASFPDIIVHGHEADRLPNTSCVSFVGTDRQSMLMALDLAGVACSSGSACTSGSSPPSHVLSAMLASDESIKSAIRFGVSKFSNTVELERAIEIISSCYIRLRK
jgi:cysteine desulfurase